MLTDPTVTFSTPLAPDLDSPALSAFGPFDSAHRVEPSEEFTAGWGDTVMAMAPVNGGRAIAVGRQGGPEFLDSELARLRHLAALVP